MTGRGRPAVGSPNSDVLQPQDQRAERDQQPEHQHARASTGCRAKVDDTSMNSLVKTPNGGRPAIAMTPSAEPDRQHRMGDRQAADVGDALGALDLRDVADREEDRRLGERMHGHVQQAGEIRERPAHAEGEGR